MGGRSPCQCMTRGLVPGEYLCVSRSGARADCSVRDVRLPTCPCQPLAGEAPKALLAKPKSRKKFLKAARWLREARMWAPIPSGALQTSRPEVRNLILDQSISEPTPTSWQSPQKNRAPAHEPNKGLTRLMGTGIVGSYPCGVFRATSSAAAAPSSRLRPFSSASKFRPSALLRRRFRTPHRW